MKSIDLIIPTRNRLQKLERCLRSIPSTANGIPIRVTVVCDGDQVTAQCLQAEPNSIRVIHVKDHSGSVYCRNLVSQTVEDALLYATDDIKFKENSIAMAAKEMEKHFPDGDGVVGFNQINAKKFSIAGVALMGQKFLRRYPDRKFLFPGYFHFSCQEVEYLGKKLGKIMLAKKARIIHYHPSFMKSESDDTHREARKYRKLDRKLSNQRHAKGLIWGDNSGT